MSAPYLCVTANGNRTHLTPFAITIGGRPYGKTLCGYPVNDLVHNYQTGDPVQWAPHWSAGASTSYSPICLNCETARMGAQ